MPRKLYIIILKKGNRRKVLKITFGERLTAYLSWYHEDGKFIRLQKLKTIDAITMLYEEQSFISEITKIDGLKQLRGFPLSELIHDVESEYFVRKHLAKTKYANLRKKLRDKLLDERLELEKEKEKESQDQSQEKEEKTSKKLKLEEELDKTAKESLKKVVDLDLEDLDLEDLDLDFDYNDLKTNLFDKTKDEDEDEDED